MPQLTPTPIVRPARATAPKKPLYHVWSTKGALPIHKSTIARLGRVRAEEMANKLREMGVSRVLVVFAGHGR